MMSVGCWLASRAAGGAPDQVVALRVERPAAVGSGNRAGVAGQDRPLQVHGVSGLRKCAAAIRRGVGGDRRAQNVDGRSGEADYVDSAPVGGGAVPRDGAVDHVQDRPRLGVDPATLAIHTGCDIAGHRGLDDGQRHVAEHVEAAPGSRGVAGDRRAGDRRSSAGPACLDATSRSAVCPTGDGQPVEGGGRRANHLENAVNAGAVHRAAIRIPGDRQPGSIGDVKVAARSDLIARGADAQRIASNCQRNRVRAAARRAGIDGRVGVGGANCLAQGAVAVAGVVVVERAGGDGCRMGLGHRQTGQRQPRARR